MDQVYQSVNDGVEAESQTNNFKFLYQKSLSKEEIKYCYRIQISNNNKYLVAAFSEQDKMNKTFHSLTLYQFEIHQMVELYSLIWPNDHQILGFIFSTTNKVIYCWCKIVILLLHISNIFDVEQISFSNSVPPQSVEQVVLYKNEERMVICDSQLLFFNRINTDRQCIAFNSYNIQKWNLTQTLKIIDVVIDKISLSSSEKQFIGKSLENDILLVFQCLSNNQWKQIRKIMIQYQYQTIDLIYFIQDSILLYNGLLIFFNQWGRKIMKKNAVSQKIYSSFAIYNQFKNLILSGTDDGLLIFKLNKNKWNLIQQQQAIPESNCYDIIPPLISKDGLYLIICDSMNFIIFKNTDQN